MYRIAILIAFFCLELVSAQSIITDRPDQTESSSTIAKGSLQIEAGVLFGSVKDDFFSQELVLAPTVLWRYGITKGIELRVLTEFASVKDKLASQKASGLTDLQLGTKIQIFKDSDVNTEIAFLSHAIIPTAKDELSLNKLGTINKLSISHELSDSIGLGYNVGYDYFGYGSGNLTYSVALGIGLSDTIGLYIEPYGNLVEFDWHQASFDAGFTYLVNNNCQLDISYGTGLNHTMNYFSIGTSFFIPKGNKSTL